MVERARFCSAFGRPVPTISTRSAPRGGADPLVTLPALEAAAALEEGDALAARVAGGGDAHGVQRPGIHMRLDALERQVPLEHARERRVVEERDRVLAR